jgi:hypothetical protein
MDNTKTCKKCGEEKPLSEFYKHKAMKDGRLKECKVCFRKAALDREREKSKNPEFVEEKRQKSKAYYHRKKQEAKEKSDIETYPWLSEKAFLSLPERFPLKKGQVYHHWNLKPKYQHDIFVLSERDKAIADKFMTFDMKSRMYMTNDGRMLDNKRKHKDFLVKILGKDAFKPINKH